MLVVNAPGPVKDRKELGEKIMLPNRNVEAQIRICEGTLNTTSLPEMLEPNHRNSYIIYVSELPVLLLAVITTMQHRENWLTFYLYKCARIPSSAGIVSTPRDIQ